MSDQAYRREVRITKFEVTGTTAPLSLPVLWAMAVVGTVTITVLCLLFGFPPKWDASFVSGLATGAFGLCGAATIAVFWRTLANRKVETFTENSPPSP